MAPSRQRTRTATQVAGAGLLVAGTIAVVHKVSEQDRSLDSLPSCFAVSTAKLGRGAPAPAVVSRAALTGPTLCVEGPAAEPAQSSTTMRVVAGIASLVALRAFGKGYGRGGKGDGRGGKGGGKGGGGGRFMDAETQAQMRTAKRQREADQFWMYQRRLLRTGAPNRDDMHWRREERNLFKTSHVTKGINFEKYDDIPVDRVGGQGLEEPMDTFQDATEKYNLPELLAKNFERCGYSVPTPVQKHSIPAAMVGTDVMVSAQTGSGKTAAFLVPIITTALQAGAKPLEEGPARPTSVVLAPTRELCQQITQEAKRLCFRTPIRVVSIYGGADAMPQLKAMAEGCEIVICTPGRLEDFLEREVISMEDVKYLALDEADRMLDMGFEPQIRSIIEEHDMPMPGVGEEGSRQTMMFSATFPKEMQDLALDFLDPSYMWIGVGRVSATSTNVEQRFADCGGLHEDQKFDTLLDSLESVTSSEGGTAKTIIFANQKTTVDDVAWRLSDQRIRAAQIHGGLSQAQRDRAIRDLKDSRVHVLVATDVAARGLDLPGIDHVVNYELPTNAEDYVHRIGRTGRIGNTGVATSFVGRMEPSLQGIVKHMRDAVEQDDDATPIPDWLEDKVRRNRGGGGGGYGSRYNSRRGPGRGRSPGRSRSPSPSRSRSYASGGDRW